MALRVSGKVKFVSLLAALALGLEVVPPALAQTGGGYDPPHQRPGPASDRIRFQSVHVDLAPKALTDGKIDFYEFSLKTEAARQLRQDPSATVYQAPASSVSLILNPAPAPPGQLNPFAMREVRFALQYAVDRGLIAQDIYKGQAEPMVAHVGPTDFDYLTVYDEIKSLDISYDPEYARSQVEKAMTGAGATLSPDGRWQYNGQPVRLNFIIRVEDERRDVGDLVRAALEKLGFTVATSYLDFAPAIQRVYGSDPALLQWHLYTEGWSRGSAERYDYGTINSMAAPWMGNMPGWQEVGFWQYQNARLDELGKKLFQGAFRDRSERDHLYREMTRLALDESVRIWVATVVNSLPASRELRGVTQDVTAGPKSILTLREAHVPGRDTLNVGNLWVWTARTTWNPVGGFGDVYSSDIWQTLYDPPTTRDPFSGVPAPFRATYQVTTAGPDGKLDVPSDALLWDAKADAFTPVAADAKATSKVVFDYSRYFQSRWHDGQPIAMADVLYSIAQRFDLAMDPDKSRIEVALAVTSRPYLDTVRGFRVLDDNRLEVYADYWHFVEGYIAEYASPSGVSMPWEVLAGMDRLVFTERRAAYSDTAAQRYSVPWLSLVMDNDARLLRRTLVQMRDRGDYPASTFRIGDRTLVSAQDARARLDAAIAWIDQRGMAVISNGPFQLVRYDPPGQFAEVEAFRDPSYPFKPGDWYKGASPSVAVTSVNAPRVGIGSAAAVRVRAEGPGTVGVRYALVDPAAREIVDGGEAQRRDGEYVIDLAPDVTRDLKPGFYQLSVLAYSDQVSSLGERRVDLEVATGQTVERTPGASPGATQTPQKTGGGFSCSGPAGLRKGR